MKIKPLIIIVLSITSLSFLKILGVRAYCSQSPEKYQPTVMRENYVLDFKSLIITSDNKIVDLTGPLELRTYQEFQTIYNNPGLYVNEALKALESSEFTEQQKQIIALSMQNLNLNKFVTFSKNVLSLLEEGKIANSVFEDTVLPGYEWSTRWVDYSSSAKVQEILSEILQSNAVSEENKKYIKEYILTGKAQADVEHLRDIGAIKPKLCS